MLMSRRWWLAIFLGTKNEASANFVNASLPVSVAGKGKASISKLSVKRLDDSRKIVESVSQRIQQLIKIRCLEAGHVVKKLPVPIIGGPARPLSGAKPPNGPV